MFVPLDDVPGEWPARMPSPFAHGAPHPLARRAMEALRPTLDGLSLPTGKMFGVLVARAADGTVGTLRAFSGQLGGSWLADGWAPPLFDLAARQAFWPAGEAELDALDRQLAELTEGDPARTLARARRELAARQAEELTALKALHAERRARRAELRAAGHDRKPLDGESRRDDAEHKRCLQRQRRELEPLAAEQAVLDECRRSIEAARAARSSELLRPLFDGYTIVNARGETRTLWSLFAPELPPGGAGDCAAPKLLAAAHRLGLTPLVLAEMWWGPPPVDGGRTQGQFYPACRRRCGGVLPFMLEGLNVDPPPLFGAAPPPGLSILWEDEHLVAVNKPAGLLAVPGRHHALKDSVATRLARLHPGAQVVHRLDLDTSGVLLCARTPEALALVQKQFAMRTVDKRYIAWLDGTLAGESGDIDLPIRLDIDDRPRHVVDPVHGRPAQTRWQVLARQDGRTRVAFWPRTGRTHQLRVHAAHRLGLGVPIVGDRLYGADGPRLMLHAETLAFTHPVSGQRVELAAPAPF